MSRELSRRLSALEKDSGGDQIRYIVSDRARTYEQWHATKNGGDVVTDEPAGLDPTLTEAEWIAAHGILSEVQRQ